MRCAVLDIRTVSAAELARREPAAEPERRAGGPAFNCSHSGNFVCCAVHKSTVGVDLEARRPVRAALAARICTPEELVFTAPGGRFDSLRFLQLWTAKEAWVKYTGEGLGVDFRTLPAAAADGLHETLFGRRLEQTITEDYVLSVVYDAV